MMPACLGLKPQNMDPWILVLPFIQIKFPRLGEEWTGAAFLLLLHLAAKLLNDKLQKKKKGNVQWTKCIPVFGNLVISPPI